MILEKNTLPLHGRLWIQVHSQVVSIRHNPEFRKKLLDRLDTKNVKNSDFLSILYSKPLREYKKPKSKTEDRFLISKYHLPFRKGYKPQFTKEVFAIVAISSRKPSTYTIKHEQDENICGEFYKKELIKVIKQWNSLRKKWF